MTEERWTVALRPRRRATPSAAGADDQQNLLVPEFGQLVKA